MEKYIDVHCHLEVDRFKDDLDEVIERAKEKGVLIIQSGIDPKTNRKSLEIKEKYGVMCSFGIYPIDGIAEKFDDLSDDYMRDIVPFSFDDEIKWIEENIDSCVAIGEIGLEFKVIECTDEIRSAQIKNFKRLIELAKKYDKPIVIHSRGGELECTDILEESGHKKVIMHSFNGKKSLIKRGVENGWFFSIPPVITRLNHFEMLVEVVPLSQLLTETDSPWLSPVYGERNEPANVIVTVKRIAEIKGLSEEEARDKLFENAKKLFLL